VVVTTYRFDYAPVELAFVLVFEEKKNKRRRRRRREGTMRTYFGSLGRSTGGSGTVPGFRYTSQLGKFRKLTTCSSLLLDNFMRSFSIYRAHLYHPRLPWC